MIVNENKKAAHNQHTMKFQPGSMIIVYERLIDRDYIFTDHSPQSETDSRLTFLSYYFKK